MSTLGTGRNQAYLVRHDVFLDESHILQCTTLRSKQAYRQATSASMAREIKPHLGRRELVLVDHVNVRATANAELLCTVAPD